jgi:hypothetical protein
MSETDFQMILKEIERLREECDTAEKATLQLQNEGLLDASGEIAEKYREPSAGCVWL